MFLCEIHASIVLTVLFLLCAAFFYFMEWLAPSEPLKDGDVINEDLLTDSERAEAGAAGTFAYDRTTCSRARAYASLRALSFVHYQSFPRLALNPVATEHCSHADVLPLPSELTCARWWLRHPPPKASLSTKAGTRGTDL